MSQNGTPSSVKTLVIIVLLLVVGIQGYFLWRGQDHQTPGQTPGQGAGQTAGQPGAQTQAVSPAPASPAPAKSDKGQGTVSIAKFSVDWKHRNTLHIVFDKPIGEAMLEKPLEGSPFALDPELPGQWSWSAPQVLTFTAKSGNRFSTSQNYKLTANPEAFLPQGTTLTGDKTITVAQSCLWLREFRTYFDTTPEDKTKGRAYVWMSFNGTVDRQALLRKVSFIDPLRGEARPIAAQYPDKKPGEEGQQEGQNAQDDPDMQGGQILLVSEPVPLDPKRTLTVRVDRDIDGVCLGGGPGEAWQAQIAAIPETGGDFSLERAEPYPAQDNEPAVITLRFSAKVDPAEVKRALSVTPQVAFTIEETEPDRSIRLRGPFQAGNAYTLALDQGFKAVDGRSLAGRQSLTVNLPDLGPAASFADKGMFLTKSGSKSVAVRSVNTAAVRVNVERVYRNNIFFSLNYYDDTTFGDAEYGADMELLPYLGDSLADYTVKTPKVKNQQQRTTTDLWPHLKDFEPGLYRVRLGAKEGGNSYQSWQDQRWMLITDLGIAAKRGHDDIMVWVSSLKDLSPVVGARVKVLSSKNQVIWQGTTDARGLWLGVGLSELGEDRQPYMITVEKDTDYSFLQFERFQTDMTGLDVSGVEVAKAGYQAFLWGERDIYRPGETATGMIAVRDPSLKTPAPMPVKLRWSDPQGREIGLETVKTDAQGLVAFSRTMPVHFPTGPYLLEAMVGDEPIGQYRFQVEDFKPDRISTAVKPDVERAAPGKDLRFTVEGRYLFGAPASGMASEAQVVLTPAPFAPKGFDGYVFGDPERVFEPQTISQEQAQLDDEGRAAFAAAVPAGLKPPAALYAVVTARVSEAGGRGVAARVKIPVDAYPAYPGLKKLGDSGLAPGQAHTFEYVVLDGQGQEAQVQALTAELFEDRWQTVLRRTEDGRGFKYETKRDAKLVEKRVLASPGAKGQVAFTPPKYGSYRLMLTDPATGAAVQLSFWADGQGYNPWAMENPARLEFVAGKTDYLPGETAKLQVRAPFPGKLLLTVESTGVKDVYVVDLPANTGEVSVPIKPGYAPNVYVTGMLARKGTDVHSNQAGRAFGTLSLNVAREAGRQNVAIMAPELVKPKTKLTITAKADPGSIVTLAAVDEGILQLIAQKTPDPWAAFYAKRGLEVTSYDTWAMLLPEAKPQVKKSPAGGDEDLSRFLRTESPQGEKSVAYWSGPLKADAQGRVQWTIELPQFQGALRIMAVAVNGLRFGSAQHMTRVKSPLVLLPTFPRFAQMDETMRLPVTLRNDTGADGSFKLSLDASGPMNADEPVKSLDIPSGKDRTVFFTVRTGASEGVAALTLKAVGNNESTDARAELLVRSPLPAVSRILSGSNEGPVVDLKAADAAGFLPGTLRRDLRLGRYPLVRYAGKLETLLGYPYGCIEQTVSKAFPLLYFSNLARELEPEALAKSSPEAAVQQGISRALSMQHYSGGFGMWPGAEREQPWASVYATHFLLEASKAGYQVAPQALNQAMTYLAESVKRQQTTLGGQKTQAYGLYVLARAGKPDRGMMDHLRTKIGAKLPSDARALLAAAYVAAGNAKGGEPLLADLTQAAPAPRVDDVFDSPLRAVALTLAALADANPAAPETAATARELARLMETTPIYSTQEAGMAFMAMGKLFARQQATGTCAGQVLAGQNALARFDTAKVTVMKNIQGDGPLSLALDPGCAPGSVFYTLDARGIPQRDTYKPFASGLEITREFLDREGRPLNMAKLPQGAMVVVKTSLRSTSGPVAHVALSQLLPSGLEVENPRLDTTDRLPWMGDKAEPAATSYADYRADRVNVFLDLPVSDWKVVYTVCRAVIPGTYTLPPAQAEAMYYPEIKAGTDLGTMSVEGGQ